jgi:hypothetical protein
MDVMECFQGYGMVPLNVGRGEMLWPLISFTCFMRSDNSICPAVVWIVVVWIEPERPSLPEGSQLTCSWPFP